MSGILRVDQWGDHGFLQRVVTLRVLHGRINAGGQFGLGGVTARDIGVADLALLIAHRAACDGHFAQIERGPTATGTPAHHHQPGFRPAQSAKSRQFGCVL